MCSNRAPKPRPSKTFKNLMKTGQLLFNTLIACSVACDPEMYIQRIKQLNVCVLSCFSCVWLLVTLWIIAHQVPLPMRFSRRKYWSRLPCPPPGDLPDLGIKSTYLMSPALAGKFFNTSTTWEARNSLMYEIKMGKVERGKIRNHWTRHSNS